MDGTLPDYEDTGLQGQWGGSGGPWGSAVTQARPQTVTARVGQSMDERVTADIARALNVEGLSQKSIRAWRAAYCQFRAYLVEPATFRVTGTLAGALAPLFAS